MKIRVNSFEILNAIDELNPRMSMLFTDVQFFEGDDISGLPENGYYEFTQESVNIHFWALKKRRVQFTRETQAKIIDQIERTGRAVIL